MTGKIIKGIAGFYYVYSEGSVYECKARGAFRNQGIKPLCGDEVILEVIDEHTKEGSIEKILPRKNAIIRPAVANVDETMLVFALRDPEIPLNLLDRYLLMMQRQNLPCVLAFSKSELGTKEQKETLKKRLAECGCRVLFFSSKLDEGLDEIRAELRGKTTVLAGPSGVGKSTLMNTLCPEAMAQTGELSEKIRRGKNTTRHTEIFCIEKDTFLLDTPGFTSLNLPEDIEAEDLRFEFPEFEEYEGKCRFRGCVHVKEPDCAVKAAVADGKIDESRYKNYCAFYEEIKGRNKWH